MLSAHKVMKIFKYIISTAISVYFIIGVLLFILQRDFLYYPSDAINHNFTTKTIITGNVALNIVVLNPGKKSAILYFGGNAESVVRNADNFLQYFPDHTVYLHNYRGYGGSLGNPTEKSLYEDSQLLYDNVCIKQEQCSVIGRSLGSGIATFLASTRKINKLVLVTPYDSIESIAQGQYPMYPISLLLKDKYDSVSRVNNISSKTLVILAEHDNVIPRRHSQLLISAFKPNTISVSIIKNTGHNNISSTSKYHQLMYDFLY